MKIFFVKFLFILFWLLIIFGFLYSPYLKNKLSPDTINVLTWGDMISQEQVEEFQKLTGIKVILNFYETNDELFAKLQITKGKEYDLITIADNALHFFQENKTLSQIDKSKLDFFDDIEPNLFKNYFDPNFDYSIPYYWDIYGFAVNKKLINNQLENGWASIFDKSKTPGNIAMTDDAFNATLIAGQYLFKNVKNLNQEQLNQIQDLLLKQKNWVKLYTDLRSDYVLKIGSSPLAVTQSAYVYKVLNADQNLQFIIPKEGSFLIINTLIIPISSLKQNLTYKFINFLCQKKIMKKHFEKFGYLPARKSVLQNIDTSHISNVSNILKDERFKQFSFFESNISLDKVNEIWVAVKA